MEKGQSNIVTLNETGLFYKFAIPNIFSFILVSSAGIVDGVFIGRCVGEIALAAVNIAQPIFSFVWGISMMVMVGGAVSTGKYLGEKNIEKACQIFTKSIIIVALITIIISLSTFIFAGEIISLIGGSDKTTPIAVLYIKVILPFAIFTTLGYGLSVFARVDGFPVTASIALTGGALINIILDAVFIVKLNMGVKGAAYATGLSYIIPFIILVIHFLIKRGTLSITLKIKGFAEIFKSSLNGLSEFLNEISVGITMALFNIIMMKYAREEGVAAFTAINYILWLGNMVNYAAADSLNPLISTNYGAGKFDRIKNFLKTGLIFTVSNGIFIFLLISFFGEYLTAFFIKNTSSDAFYIALDFMSIVKWSFFLSGVNMIYSSYFTAMLRPKESAVIAILRSLILPCSLLLILPLYFNKTGIYLTIPISELFTFAVALYIFQISKKFLLKR